MSRRTLLAIAICSAALSGCGQQPTTPTLADLPRINLPEETAVEIPQVDVNTLLQNYEQALSGQTDPMLRRHIALRLADLEMERLEQLQADNPGQQVSFQGAIDRYEALVGAGSDDDYLLYRLARARSLQGEAVESLVALEQIARAAPESPFMAEVLFRRGESSFNRRNYRAAAADFEAVLAHGDSPFADNARYMLGWSRFKDSDYPGATRSFLQLLDTLHSNGAPAEQSAGVQRLTDDSLRGLALAFSYQGGAKVIESYNPHNQPRPYQHRLYESLGDWYREKERFRESANTYLTYVEQYPQTEQAPRLHLRAIETLQVAGLAEEILPAKREFVQRYGIRGAYWGNATDSQRQQLGTWLRPWIIELAQFDHARAQALQKQKARSNRERKTLADQARSAFFDAAALYREFTESFPQDSETPEMAFLMAECLEQGGDFAGAWRAYRDVARTYPQHARGAEAGYAAILNAQSMARQLRGNQLETEQAILWLDRKIEAGLYFAETWPSDSRALAVLIEASDQLYRQNRYPEAIAAAGRALDWQPPASRIQQESLNLLLGQSHFELKQFAQAEQAYQRVLADPAAKPSNAQVARQKMQAAIYRQAELALAADMNEDGIRHLLRIRNSGRSEIAATAQYDAINKLIELERWQRAAEEITDFRRFYAAHSLTPTLAAKAVVIYQALSMPGAAASELLQLARTDADPQVRRQSLYLAAESYQQAGDTKRAIDTYRQYSEQWQEPRAQQLEAQFQLAELYKQSNDPGQYRYWLTQLAAARPDTDRARYLAASAQSTLAEQSYQAFARIPLKLPLKQSLASKKRAMDATVADYRKVIKLGVAKFSTQANFRLAEVYRQLSGDLMDSQRPAGLNALELEQYEILLEEQAYPFEEKAIELHEANIQRTSDGIYDSWVKQSFQSLAKLLPGRYLKNEKVTEWSDALH